VLEKSFWNAFERFKPTSISGVPYTFQMLERLKFFSREISCITKITQAGGKLSEDLALSIGQKCLEKNIDFYIMYGQSEATARMSYLPPNFLLRKPDSVGIAIPDGMFWLEDDYGNKVIDVNATGNLIYSGSNVSMGYAKSWRDLSSGDQNMKILYTGDLARIDDEGFVYIAGRQKRFIKIFGNRVNLDDIENFLSKNQLISAAAGSDDHLQIHIEDNGIGFEIADIKKLVSRFLKVHPSSIKINIVSKLPRNKSGKIQYKELN
jgi:acyl-coenzyme A synthetase/AMP-(fatty) acid ligase